MWRNFASRECITQPVNTPKHSLALPSSSISLFLRQMFIRIVTVSIQSVIIHSGTRPVSSVFVLPRLDCLIPSTGRLSGFQGCSSVFNQAHCHRVGSALLGNYENSVTGFKWWSCVCREHTASVDTTSTRDLCFLFWINVTILCLLHILKCNYL